MQPIPPPPCHPAYPVVPPGRPFHLVAGRPRKVSLLVEAVNASGRRAAMLRALSETPMENMPRLKAQMLDDQEVGKKPNYCSAGVVCCAARVRCLSTWRDVNPHTAVPRRPARFLLLPREVREVGPCPPNRALIFGLILLCVWVRVLFSCFFFVFFPCVCCVSGLFRGWRRPRAWNVRRARGRWSHGLMLACVPR